MITLAQSDESGSIDMDANVLRPELDGKQHSGSSHLTIGQPEDVFTVVPYWDFVERYRKTIVQYDQLYQMALKRPTRQERLYGPEKDQLDSLSYQLKLLRREYGLRLPIHLLARCPYCQSPITQPVDTFSLLGCYPFFNMTDLYLDRSEFNNHPPRRRCKHAILSIFAVNLNGLPANDISKSGIPGKSMALDSAPRLIVWPLIARKTSVVIHALPISRLSDPGPTHCYTAYFTTYFAADDSNLFTEDMWVSTDAGRPATGGVMINDELLKWVKAGRLFWLDPIASDKPLLGRDVSNEFPYADVQPKGWYEILEDGQVNGPKPYSYIWQGTPPEHLESFSHTIE